MVAEPERLPRITIGIPVYNAAATLPLALQSVFAQTFSDWELLLVDDGSTDESVEIMRAIRDDRVKVVVNPENKTTAPRLNQINQLARAPLIARMDADDAMHPERLSRQIAYLDAHPEVEVLGTALYSIDPECTIRGRRSISHKPASDFAAGIRVPVFQGTTVGRTTWFRSNPYNESVHARRCEDTELWFRTYDKSVIESLDEPLMFVREDVAKAMRKLRSSNLGRLRVMFLGHGELRKKKLSVRLAIAAVISAKMLVYEVAWLFGKRDYLIKRRNTPLDPQQAEEARLVMQRLQHYRVPGLS